MPILYLQALSLYRDASELCQEALGRRPNSASDATFFKDVASLVSSRCKVVEDSLVASVERHLLAKNGLTARYMTTASGVEAGDEVVGAEWLQTVLSRCSQPSTRVRTDPEDVPTTDAASLSSSSTSSLTGTG